jgi:regulatory protein
MADRQAPDEASLYDAALRYVARYATTQARLRQVLERRIEQWKRSAEDRDVAADIAGKARAAVPGVVERVVTLGLVSDTAFAESRVRSLTRAGRSKRMVAAALAAKGVGAETARAAIAGDEMEELTAALILARRRRIGPFRKTADGDRNREFGMLARAGFPRNIATAALDMEPEEAEARIAEARR